MKIFWNEPTVSSHDCLSSLVGGILDRPIQWVKWREFNRDQRRMWGNEARALLENPVFRSLCGTKETSGEIVKDLIEKTFRYSERHEQTRDARMIMCGIELIREKVEEMLWNEQNETRDDILNPI